MSDAQEGQESNALNAKTAIRSLKERHPGPDSWLIMREVETHMPDGASLEHLETVLMRISEDYQSLGDIYMAETTDILRDTLHDIRKENAPAPHPAAKSPPPPRA